MAKVLRGMRQILDVPVTVKFRTGVKQDVFTTHKLVPVFEEIVSFTLLDKESVAFNVLVYLGNQSRYCTMEK